DHLSSRVARIDDRLRVEHSRETDGYSGSLVCPTSVQPASLRRKCTVIGFAHEGNCAWLAEIRSSTNSEPAACADSAEGNWARGSEPPCLSTCVASRDTLSNRDHSR